MTQADFTFGMAISVFDAIADRESRSDPAAHGEIGHESAS
jgi:hypothetical protein